MFSLLISENVRSTAREIGALEVEADRVSREPALGLCAPQSARLVELMDSAMPVPVDRRLPKHFGGVPSYRQPAQNSDWSATSTEQSGRV